MHILLRRSGASARSTKPLYKKPVCVISLTKKIKSVYIASVRLWKQTWFSPLGQICIYLILCTVTRHGVQAKSWAWWHVRSQLVDLTAKRQYSAGRRRIAEHAVQKYCSSSDILCICSDYELVYMSTLSAMVSYNILLWVCRSNFTMRIINVELVVCGVHSLHLGDLLGCSWRLHQGIG